MITFENLLFIFSKKYFQHNKGNLNEKNHFSWMVILAPGTIVFCSTAFAKKVVVVSGIAESSVKEIGYDLVYNGVNECFQDSDHELVYQWYDFDAVIGKEGKTAIG